ncbi:hypothetical protein BS78_02G004500 [Paspalum vaginatum]|nr:hypothetical protein BS78_02G004500 [Paspalum vaginatum]
MKTTKATAAAQEDDDDPRKIRSSRSKRRRARRSHPSSSSQSPPRKRSKKHSKRIPDKKSKRSKVSGGSRRHRHRSLSPSRSPSSSPSSVTCHSSSTSSSSASERSVSPPPRSRSRDVARKKGRGRDRERDHKGRKVRRSTSFSGTSPSSGSSRSRSRSKGNSRKWRAAGGTKDGATRDKIEKDYTDRPSSRSHKNRDDDGVDRDEEAPATIAKKGDDDIHSHKKNVDSERMESPPSKNANETEVALPAAAGGANSDAEDLELILRKKALENFRKFRAAATMSGKADNLTTGKEASTDSPQNASTKIAEATDFQRQGSSLGVSHSTGSSRPEDRENGVGHSWKQESSAGMSPGAGSPGILEAGEAGVPTQQKGRTVEGTHPASQFRSPQDDRNSRSVMQRLMSTPGSSVSVKQRLGTSAGVIHVSGAPKVRSVVSIPAREGLDGSTHTTASRPSDDSAPVQSSSEVGLPLGDVNKVEAEGTNGGNRKTSEASASNGSILSPAEDKSQARIEDKDGFQKKTFSRMHDGEAVEVSYKVYIPKKTPALARRKLRR